MINFLKLVKYNVGMRLILVRHGETEDNAAEIIQGQTDGQLTATGRAQAESAALKLKDIRIDAIYTSDLKRVKDTAAAIAAQLPEMARTEDMRLREQDFGIFEGRPIIELLREMRRSKADFTTFVPHGGEGRAEFQSRIIDFFAEIRDRHAGNTLGRKTTVLVITHYGVINILIGWLLSHDHPRSIDWHIANGSLTILDIDETGRGKPFVSNNLTQSGETQPVNA